MKKKKCEQYWPAKVDDQIKFEHMAMKFVAESRVECDEGQKSPTDLIHRKFEVTNLKSRK